MTWRILVPADQLHPKEQEPAYTGGRALSIDGLLEADTAVQGVHQAYSVELGLNTLKEGTEKGRGGNDWRSAQSGTCSS